MWLLWIASCSLRWAVYKKKASNPSFFGLVNGEIHMVSVASESGKQGLFKFGNTYMASSLHPSSSLQVIMHFSLIQMSQ